MLILQCFLFLFNDSCGCGAGAGVDSAWEHRKLEARKMPENVAESPAFSAALLVLFWIGKINSL
jgi:hypothetical protein